MCGIRIKEAVKSFNERRKKTEDKLNGVKLGKMIFPDLSMSTIKGNVWRLENGKQKISSEEIQLVCEICNVDPNFLFGYKSKFKLNK